MDETLKLVETFGSTLQGEGLRTSFPSIFLRFGLCNLRCPGFGLKKGEQNTEIPMIIKNIDQYKTYDDLPLSKTGCDSYPASWGEFKRFFKEFTFEQLADRIVELKNQTCEHCDLVLTGGEPLLKPTQRKLVKFFEQYSDLINSFETLTFETNGTQEISEELKTWLSLRCKIPVIFSISPKLECSGEPENKRIVPSAIESIKNTVIQIKKDNEYVHKNPASNVVDATMYLKYVVSNETDIEEALTNAKILGYRNHIDGEIYLMPVGGTFEEYMSIQTKIAELTIKHDCVFCPRIHTILFRNCWKK